MRTGGYVVDFWGTGYDVADRMNLLEEIRWKGYFGRDVRAIDRSGKQVAGFPASAFARATGGGYVSLPRGDLALSIFARLQGRVATIFHDNVLTIAENNDGVRVRFASGAEQTFDL